MDKQWTVKLGVEMPNFQCVTTRGTFNFHDFCGSDPKRPYTVLFSHPKDFTPVCTTELGMCEVLTEEFAKRSVKMIGISCDSVEEHIGWSEDILAVQGLDRQDNQLSFPMISDSSRQLVTMLGFIDPEELDAAGLPLSARALILIGPDRTVKLSILYPATTGRSFREFLRAMDSVLLTGLYNLATPANWRPGDRCSVPPTSSTEDAEKQFCNLATEDLPSGKNYLRHVDCPKEIVVPEYAPMEPGEVVIVPPTKDMVDAAWRIKLGAVVPDFEAVTTSGKMMFHQFLESDEAKPYTLVFTHTKDFTPVCTTELTSAHQLEPDFGKRGVKMCGISCDSLEMHVAWQKDILHRAGDGQSELAFLLMSDPDRQIVMRLGMLDPAEKDAAGVPLPARAVLFIGADKRIKFSILYPATTGRDFTEVLRAIDSVLLTGKHLLFTPADWKQGERCIVAPKLPTDVAKAAFSNFVQKEVPSGKPYLRYVASPTERIRQEHPADESKEAAVAAESGIQEQVRIGGKASKQVESGIQYHEVEEAAKGRVSVCCSCSAPK